MKKRKLLHKNKQRGSIFTYVEGDRSFMRRQEQLGMVLLLFIIVAAGCGSKSNSNVDIQTPAASAGTSEASVKAQELFKKTNCISCHGVDLSGRVGPKTNLQKVGTTMTKEQIAQQIREGGGGMPVYKSKLTDEEINLLTDWLSAKK
jgi:cytochrome c551